MLNDKRKHKIFYCKMEMDNLSRNKSNLVKERNKNKWGTELRGTEENKLRISECNSKFIIININVFHVYNSMP